MVKCSDCWCEHYDKSKGNCDHCLKSQEAKDSADIRVILQRRAVKQMELDNKSPSKGQSR